jgi:hypothetical protein
MSARFTPNTQRGDSNSRVVVYQHEIYRDSVPWSAKFSATPDGPTFIAYMEQDDCGLGCRCAAFLIPLTAEGAAIYATALPLEPVAATRRYTLTLTPRQQSALDTLLENTVDDDWWLNEAGEDDPEDREGLALAFQEAFKNAEIVA